MKDYYFAWMGGKNLIVKNAPSLSLAKRQAELWDGENSLGAADMVVYRLAKKSDVAVYKINFSN